MLEAGVDQFGGESCPELVIELVRSGQLSEERIDESARRILRDKFRLGLFDTPYLDEDVAERIVGHAEFRAAGDVAQRKAITLLKNGAATPVLPLQGRPKIYVENIDPATAGEYGDVVATPGEADLAILRINTPYEPRNGNFLESFFHAGALDYAAPELQRILGILATIPTIVAIHLDRPAVIPEIAAQSVALLGEFGASDVAVLDVIFGRFAPVGKLPFELPASMEAVRGQYSDLPYDSEVPVFPFGHGLGYAE